MVLIRSVSLSLARVCLSVVSRIYKLQKTVSKVFKGLFISYCVIVSCNNASFFLRTIFMNMYSINLIYVLT